MKNLFIAILAVSSLALFSCNGAGAGAAKLDKKETPSGYEYIHHIQNDGPKVQEGDKVFFHLVVNKNDTSKLQSSYDQGRTFPQIIPPLDKLQKPYPPTYEALVMMAEGDSMTIWQKLDSLPNLPPQFKPTDIIRFDLKLVEIQTKAEVDAAIAAGKAKEEAITNSTQDLIKSYNEGKLKSKLKTTASGLKYMIHKEGTGKNAESGKSVKVNYAGFLTNGTGFDNSFKRGEPIEFPLGTGSVIKGWDEGLALLNPGSEATLFIPYELAYGEDGRPPSIPGKSELVFFVELVDANY